MDHVTPYDRLAVDDAAAEQLLVAGSRDLAAWFGESEYGVLRRLALRAAVTPRDPRAPVVVIVPGMMGSLLGIERPAPLPADVLWLDPVDFQLGRLGELALRTPRRPATAAVVPLAPVLHSYLRLRLRLRAAGFEVHIHPYDWRRDLRALGQELAARLPAHGPVVALVGHSMGGLVARAALTCPGSERVARVVLIGTPNFGSYAPLQALRGTYPLVRQIARLDPQRSAEELASSVFSSFPSLYEMLPRALTAREPDLFDPRTWPAEGPAPRTALLDAARATAGHLAPADARFCNVIGVSQPTVASVARRAGQFVYGVSRCGDGTVPMARAGLPGCRALYVASLHGELSRDPRVLEALIGVIRHGRSRRLATRAPRGAGALARIGERALRRLPAPKVDFAQLDPADRQAFLMGLNAPNRPDLPVRSARHRPRRRSPRPAR